MERLHNTANTQFYKNNFSEYLSGLAEEGSFILLSLQESQKIPPQFLNKKVHKQDPQEILPQLQNTSP